MDDDSTPRRRSDITWRAPADRNIHVFDTGGEGRPVVLIHGWPLSHESWSEQIPALKNAGYRVVTYDRRGFGASDPGDAYDYDALTGDLDSVLTDLDLTDATLVGFSMGGGEVARYVATYGEDRLHSVVFAAAVPPYLLNTEANPDGPLTEEAANEMSEGLKTDRDAFFDDFTTTFFSAGDDLKVTEEQRQDAVRMCHQSDQEAALAAWRPSAPPRSRWWPDDRWRTAHRQTGRTRQRWLQRIPIPGAGHLPHRIASVADVPVTHVEGNAGPSL